MNKKIYTYPHNPITAIDWEQEYGLKALSRNSLIFEYNSDAYDMVVVLYENEDEFDVSDELRTRVLENGYDYEYALYNDNLELVGFVLTTETYDDCFAEEDNE